MYNNAREQLKIYMNPEDNGAFPPSILSPEKRAPVDSAYRRFLRSTY